MEFSRGFGYVPVEDHERSSSRSFSYECDRQGEEDDPDHQHQHQHHSRLRVFLPSYSDSYVLSSTTTATAAAATAGASDSSSWPSTTVILPRQQQQQRLLDIFPDVPAAMDHDQQQQQQQQQHQQHFQSYHSFHHQAYDIHHQYHCYNPSPDEIYHNNSSSSTTSSTTVSYHRDQEDQLLINPSSSQARHHDHQHFSSLYQYEHLFYKVVTPSDVGKLNRLVIPKQHAERCFPLDPSLRKKGRFLSFQETFTGKVWWFRYSYWNSSQSYVFTKGWIRFVKENKLKAGDIVSFERGSSRHENFYISCRKRPRTPSDDQDVDHTVPGGAAAAGDDPWLLPSMIQGDHRDCSQQREFLPGLGEEEGGDERDEDEEEEHDEEELDDDNVTGSTSSSQQQQQQQQQQATIKLSSPSSTRLFGVDLAATACCSSAESKSWEI